MPRDWHLWKQFATQSHAKNACISWRHHGNVDNPETNYSGKYDTMSSVTSKTHIEFLLAGNAHLYDW